MAAREDRREDPVQHIALADDHLPDLRQQIRPRGRQTLEELDVA
jgi:hypothetical protein